jgi:hypothetical protein
MEMSLALCRFCRYQATSLVKHSAWFAFVLILKWPANGEEVQPGDLYAE